MSANKLDMSRALMHVFVIFFGVGAWVAINSVFVELPILVDHLPEGWSLPSYLVVLIQAGNIGPLIVTLMQKFIPKYYHQNALIHIMLSMGTASCFLMVFFWSKTTIVNGTEHSVIFFVLFYILGLVDCTSSVTFMPYIKRFQHVFLTTLFIGEGLSGFIPSAIALTQGASQRHCENRTIVNLTTNSSSYEIVPVFGDPRFSAEVFFVCLFLLMLFCTLSFAMLNHSNFAKQFLQKKNEATDFVPLPAVEDDGKGNSASKLVEDVGDGGRTTIAPVPIQKLNLSDYIYFYAIIFWICGISNGVMPSVTSYYSLPYGILPYHFAASFGAMANPLACVIALFLPVRSHAIVGLFCTIATAFASYLMFLATQSPCPVLINTSGGAVVMVLSQVFLVFTTSYAKVSIGQILREKGHDKSLVWYGAFTQLGSLIGTLTIFPLVTVYRMFTPGDPCTTTCL